MERNNYNNRGGGRSGGGGRGGGRGRGDQHEQYYNQHYHQGRGRGGGGRGRGRDGPTYAANSQPPAQQEGNRLAYGQGGRYRPPASQDMGPTRADSGGNSWRSGYGRGGVVGGSCSASVPDQPQRVLESLPDVESLRISKNPNPSSLPRSDDKKLRPVKRPDKGGRNAIRTVNLLANQFLLKFNPETIIIHYDVDIKPEVLPKGRSGKIPKSGQRMIRDKLFSDDPMQFPLSKTAFDGEKNMFSAVPLPSGEFKVDFSHVEEMKSRSYIVTIKPVNELPLCKLKDYLSGNGHPSIPRDVLQGMDVVMKENPSRHMISVGQRFYPTERNEEDDLAGGITASKGFQQSLKPTSQGLASCSDYSILPFFKKLPVIDFLMEHIQGFRINDFRRRAREVMNVLKGLKVRITHRVTSQKFTIVGLTDQDTQHLSFDVEDPEGKVPPKKVGVVEYFRKTYGKEIVHKDIPCLDLGKNNRKNYVPMEFCILAEGQRYPKEDLDKNKNAARLLKNKQLAPPGDRKNTICEMVRSEDGPCGGDIIQNFDMQVDGNMTKVEGRVLGRPKLKLQDPNGNMKSVVDGKPIERWALLDFSSADHYFKLDHGNFIQNLRNRSRNLGIRMEQPLVCRSTQMSALSNVTRLRQLLQSVIEEDKGRLQIIVCVMSKKDPGYKYLKWISETQIGIITQCCLSTNANKGRNDFFNNLARKINAKLGGSNVELVDNQLPRFEGEEHVMFVGADVNHPASWNSTCPSIAAVVATVNWPAANRYAARIFPQHHRTEKILNFGSMCLDLVRSYAQLNKVKPKKIVVFRDGVSEGQFDMVLNEELLDLKNAIYEENYRPTITLVVAQKRHLTRLFPESERDGGSAGNVPCGAVVDTAIVHPFEFDFYLCSHDGILGTSKPTHYHVLYDDHSFTSDQLQQLIFNLCFTFARCTKPVSLVPPVFYADLVAYRGRMYQEVVMELQSSFDEKLYKLRPELEDTMFFI